MRKNDSTISLVACVDENWGIGYDDSLLFHIAEDQKFFKDLTMQADTLICGRTTYNGLPIVGYNNGEPIRGLPNRHLVVLSSIYRKPRYENSTIISKFVSGMHIAAGTDAKQILKYNSTVVEWVNRRILPYGNTMVIGGAEIYKLYWDFADWMFITKVKSNNESPKCNKYMPNVDKDKHFRLLTTDVVTAKDYNLEFCLYQRVREPLINIINK